HLRPSLFPYTTLFRSPTVRQSAALGISNDTLPDGRVSVADTFRIPGHPFTTLFFIAACGVITFSLIYKFPLNSAISFGIMLLGRSEEHTSELQSRFDL